MHVLNLFKTYEHRRSVGSQGHIVATMSWLPLLRPATGGNTTAGAQVTTSKARENDRNRAARSTSESGQVNVDIGGKLLASGSTKVSHAHSVPQSPSEANILPDITGGKRKHVNGVEGSGGNAQKRCRRTAGTDSSKTSSSLEFDGISFLPNIDGTLLASGSTRIQPDIGCKFSATGGKRELGRSKGGVAQDLGTPSAAPQSPRCSFLPNMGGTWLATGSSKIHMTSAGRDPVFPQGPAHVTANTWPDIGGQLPELPATGGKSRCVARNPASGGKSGLVGSNPATGGKSGRRKPSVPSRPPPEAWRPNAREDLPILARRFGADLSSVPEEWLDMEKSAALLQKHGLRLPVAGGKLREFRPGERIMFWEVYSGCGNATRAFLESASGDHEIAGPPVDTLRKAWPGLPSWNVLFPSVRQFLWAIMVVCQPMWVHCAPPCTFWSSLSRRTNHRTRIQDEDLRLQALVHIVFALQLCYHQMRQKHWFSLEHPPTASSWNLDLLRELVASGTTQTGPTVVASGTGQLGHMLKVEKYIFDSCRWGHEDPGNGKLYRKRQCFASNADLSSLCLRCVCRVRHQVVEGCIDAGPRKGTRRSRVAGEYPWAFCVAWADLIKSASRGT